MAHKVIMPALGMAQNTGIIVVWCKKLGDRVQAGDILLEIETDKATMEIEAGKEGIVALISGQIGVPIEVGTTIAMIAADATEAANLKGLQGLNTEKTATSLGQQPAEEHQLNQAELVAEPAKKDETQALKTTSQKPDQESNQQFSPAIQSPANTPQNLPKTVDNKILASPKARRIATERGINLQLAISQGLKEPIRFADLSKITTVSTQNVELFTELNPAELFCLQKFLQEQNLEQSSLGVIFAVLLAYAYRDITDLAKNKEIIVAIQSWGQPSDPLNLINPDQSGFTHLQKSNGAAADWTILDLTQTSMTAMKPMTNFNNPWLVIGQKNAVGSEVSQMCLNLNFTPNQLSTNQAFALMESMVSLAQQPLRLLL